MRRLLSVRPASLSLSSHLGSHFAPCCLIFQAAATSKMKYKQRLTENIAPEYGPEPYLAYGELDDIIRQLSSKAPAR